MSPQYSNTKLRKRYYDTHSTIEYHPTKREHAKALAITLALLALLVALVLLSGACTSQSGRLSQIPKEKVVILDFVARTAYDNGQMYYITDYKVKRIEQGVTDWITLQGKVRFDYNDTIYYRFIK